VYAKRAISSAGCAARALNLAKDMWMAQKGGRSVFSIVTHNVTSSGVTRDVKR